MKRTSIYILSALFLAAGISACGKTTKGKMVNDWKVTSYYEEMEFVSNGEKGTNIVSMTENSVTLSTVYTPSNGPVETNSYPGSVKLHEWAIKKDGTWSSVQEVTYPNGNSAYTNRIEQSGTWSFLRKTKGDEFEKNERVHFNVLQSKTVETQSAGFVNSTEETYLTGEKVMVYTITASKKDALEMELENSYAFTQTSGYSNSNSLVRKITLTGK